MFSFVPCVNVVALQKHLSFLQKSGLFENIIDNSRCKTPARDILSATRAAWRCNSEGYLAVLGTSACKNTDAIHSSAIRDRNSEVEVGMLAKYWTDFH